MKNAHKINSFGIGSFVFKVVSEEVQKSEVHISDFLEALRKIPGVENVSIKLDPDVYEHIIPNEGKVVLSFLDIEFDVDLSAGNFSIEGENRFKFVSRNQFDSVVTTIFPYFETEYPSDGIARVREHIRSFLNEPYILEVIGPTPFHADLFVKRTNFFGVDVEKVRGYDQIKVYVPSSDDNGVIEDIYRMLADEFDLFYMICGIEVERRKSWAKVEELVFKAHRKVEFFSFVIQDQFAFLHNYLRRAMELLAEFEADSLGYDQYINNRFSSTYSTEKNFFIAYVKEKKKEMYEYPVESTQNLLKFIADSRGRTQGTINTYVNTFVNVILGLGVAVVLYLFGIK